MTGISSDKVRDVFDGAKVSASHLYDSLKSKNYLKNIDAEEILASLKLQEIVDLNKEKKVEQKKKNIFVKLLAVIGILALVAGVAYALYCYFTPDYLDDYDEDLDELDEDFFEDETDDSDDDL